MFFLDTCGIPSEITGTINIVYGILLIAIPVIIIIFGLIDFIKAIMGKKDDEISQGAKLFVKRLIMGAVAFFVLAIVKFVVGIIAKNVSSASAAADCLIQIFK